MSARAETRLKTIEKKQEARANTRIVTADMIMERADEMNWCVRPRDGAGETWYYSTPILAAIGLLRRTTDRKLSTTKARTIADLLAAVKNSEEAVAAAVRGATLAGHSDSLTVPEKRSKRKQVSRDV